MSLVNKVSLEFVREEKTTTPRMKLDKMTDTKKDWIEHLSFWKKAICSHIEIRLGTAFFLDDGWNVMNSQHETG